MKSRLSVAIAVILFVLSSGPTSAIGQEGSDDEMPIGVPDLTIYSDGAGEVRSGIDPALSRVLGLEKRGIIFDADVTQFYQGVASGGREQEFMYGGHGDYVLNLDG